jgi:uncharacterized protein
MPEPRPVAVQPAPIEPPKARDVKPLPPIPPVAPKARDEGMAEIEASLLSLVKAVPERTPPAKPDEPARPVLNERAPLVRPDPARRVPAKIARSHTASAARQPRMFAYGIAAAVALAVVAGTVWYERSKAPMLVSSASAPSPVAMATLKAGPAPVKLETGAAAPGVGIVIDPTPMQDAPSAPEAAAPKPTSPKESVAKTEKIAPPAPTVTPPPAKAEIAAKPEPAAAPKAAPVKTDIAKNDAAPSAKPAPAPPAIDPTANKVAAAAVTPPKSEAAKIDIAKPDASKAEATKPDASKFETAPSATASVQTPPAPPSAPPKVEVAKVAPVDTAKPATADAAKSVRVDTAKPVTADAAKSAPADAAKPAPLPQLAKAEPAAAEPAKPQDTPPAAPKAQANAAVPAILPADVPSPTIGSGGEAMGAETVAAVAPPKPGDEPMWLKNALPAPPFTGQPRIAVVIDDLGLDKQRTARAIALQGPVTMSFLAYASDLPAQTEAARRAGHELIVHVPMEPINKQRDIGSNGLANRLGREEVLRRLRWDLSRFNGYVGINNHMGNRISGDANAMQAVIEELKARGLLFLDSRSIATGTAESVADMLGVPTASRDVFLDDDIDGTSIDDQLAELEDVARKQGTAIAIGHPHDQTLDRLTIWLANLSQRGFQLVPLTAIVKERNRHLAGAG